MATQSGKEKKQRSLIQKFNMSLILMYVATVLAAAPAVYFVTKNQVYESAGEDLRLLVDVIKSIKKYVGTDLRPHFMEQKIFYSPSISGIVATSRFAKYFKEHQPQYYIKDSSDNPLNPDNTVQGMEGALLSQFRENRSLKVIDQEGTIKGQQYLVSAAPTTSRKGCLRCHGDPDKAPPDVISSFGKSSGFGYGLNEVVGVNVVGVPLDDVQSLTINRSLFVILGITGLFALLFIVVNVLVRRLVLVPIVEITKVAKAVSKGDISREVAVVQRNDEIADLASAFELMRRSLLTAMKRLKRKQSSV